MRFGTGEIPLFFYLAGRLVIIRSCEMVCPQCNESINYIEVAPTLGGYCLNCDQTTPATPSTLLSLLSHIIPAITFYLWRLYLYEMMAPLSPKDQKEPVNKLHKKPEKGGEGSHVA